MLPDKRSDAFLGIPMTPEQRTIVFTELSAEGRIIPVTVDGIRFVLYILSEDTGIIEDVLSANLPTKQRCEFLAPLDPFLWNRSLIEMIFGFRYSWEIYTPADKRKYGYYVLPILYGNRFIGRIECIADYKGKILNVKNIWIENGVRHTKKMMNAIESSVRRFARFNMCSPDMENVLIR
jgi:uncharacterized protein YcaQ